MEMVIVAAVVVVAIGALATFAIAELLPQEVMGQAGQHGRFATLEAEDASTPERRAGERPNVRARQAGRQRYGAAWTRRPQARRLVRIQCK
jgi:hypothetical protein